MILPPPPTALRDPETDHVWVVVPFARPGNLQNALDNFGRQRFPRRTLVIVENGDALGACKGRVPEGVLVLTSDKHVSHAKNTALTEIRKRGGGFTAVFDDDDWYGPDYVSEAAGFARSYDLIGKMRHFVSVNGELWFCNRTRANRRGNWAGGGTIACWAEACPDYPTHMEYGEDTWICTYLGTRGATIWNSSVHHYLYRRSSEQWHTWPARVETLVDMPFARGAVTLGEVDYQVVTGAEIPSASQPVSMESASGPGSLRKVAGRPRGMRG